MRHLFLGRRSSLTRLRLLGVALSLGVFPANLTRESLADAAPPVASAAPLRAVRAALCYARGTPSHAIERSRLASWEPTDCARLTASSVSFVENELRASYTPSEIPNKLIVDFACSPVRAPLREVVLENARVQSGRLGIDRLQRDNDQFRVRRLLLPHLCTAGNVYPTGEDCVAQVALRAVSERALDSALQNAHAALVSDVHEVHLVGATPQTVVDAAPDDYSSIVLGDGTATVERSILSVNRRSAPSMRNAMDGLASAGGGPVGGGPVGGDGALRVPSATKVSVQLAVAEVLPLLAPHVYVAGAPSEGDRQFFAIRMMHVLGRNPPPWLAERYLSLAMSAGHIDLVPHLVQWITSQPNDDNSLRLKRLALSVVARVTGYDLRKDAQGAWRPLADVIADYRRDCLVFGDRSD